MKILLSFFLCCCFLLASAAPGNAACERVTPEEAYGQSDLVFVGVAGNTSSEDVGQLNPKSRTAFKTQSFLKGKHTGSIEIVTPAGSRLQKGKAYIVYAYATTPNDYLYRYEPGEYATQTDDGECGGTKRLSQAQDDLDQISALQKSQQLDRITAISAGAILLIMGAWVGRNLYKKRTHRRS